MLQSSRIYEVESRHRDMRREAHQKQLAALSLNGRVHSGVHPFARLGSWLVARGERLEARYRLRLADVPASEPACATC